MLVNVVDVPPLCNFIIPAIVRTGPLAITISTAGASPALANRPPPFIAHRQPTVRRRARRVCALSNAKAKNGGPGRRESAAARCTGASAQTRPAA